MQYGKVLKKAMIDLGIDGAKGLSDESGVSYGITLRLLASDKSVRLSDLKTTADFLDVEINFISKGV